MDKLARAERSDGLAKAKGHSLLPTHAHGDALDGGHSRMGQSDCPGTTHAHGATRLSGVIPTQGQGDHPE